MWCEDGAELGGSPREFKATEEELVWRRRKTKAEGGRENRRGEVRETLLQGVGSTSGSGSHCLHGG